MKKKTIFELKEQLEEKNRMVIDCLGLSETIVGHMWDSWKWSAVYNDVLIDEENKKLLEPPVKGDWIIIFEKDHHSLWFYDEDVDLTNKEFKKLSKKQMEIMGLEIYNL